MLGKIVIPRFFCEFNEAEWKLIQKYNSKQNSKLFIPKKFKMPETNTFHKLEALGCIYLPEEVRKKASERKNVPEKVNERDAFNTLELERNTFFENLNQKIEFHNINLCDLKGMSKRERKQVHPIHINTDLISNYPILPSLKKYALKKSNNPEIRKQSSTFKSGLLKKNLHQLNIQIPPEMANDEPLSNVWYLKSTSKINRGINLKLIKSSKFKRSKSNCINFKDSYIKRKTRISDYLKPSILQNKSELTLNKEINLLLEQEKIENNYKIRNNKKKEEENEETLSILI